MTKKPMVPNARDELDKLKMEVANELGIQNNQNTKETYLGNLSTKQTGQKAELKNVGNIGGEMVKRMIAQAEKELADKEHNK